MSKIEKDIQHLKTTVETVTSLIDQLTAAIKSPPITGSSSQESLKDINALSLAYDASSLIRAHTTKLSLLIINTPFTPSAISMVLRELGSGPLPALATAVEVCYAASYTKIVRTELQWRVEKIFTELSGLIKITPLDGKVLSAEQRDGSAGGREKWSLTATGVLWQACDDVMKLKGLGIAGLVAEKAEQYKETLKDALEELREWGEETPDNDEGDERSNEGPGNDDTNSAQDMVDNFFGPSNHIPTNDSSQIRGRLSESLQRLKLIQHLYSAVIKRRLKTVPILPFDRNQSFGLNNVVQRIDEVMAILRKLPDLADELAGAFYELDIEDIDKRMDDCFFTGFAASELLALDWKGEKDEFSSWVSSSVP
jgi:Grap2 and cyclin-D-interacting